MAKRKFGIGPLTGSQIRRAVKWNHNITPETPSGDAQNQKEDLTTSSVEVQVVSSKKVTVPPKRQKSTHLKNQRTAEAKQKAAQAKEAVSAAPPAVSNSGSSPTEQVQKWRPHHRVWSVKTPEYIRVFIRNQYATGRFSQKELAEMNNLSEKTISKILRLPDEDEIIAALKVLERMGVTVSDLPDRVRKRTKPWLPSKKS